VHIGNTSDSILTVNEILKEPLLKIIIPNSSLFHNYVIIRYNLTISKVNGEIILNKEATSGNKLTSSQIDLIKELNTGDRLIFDNLVVGCPDCRNFKLKLYSITIK
jgi:hypothetical protein